MEHQKDDTCGEIDMLAFWQTIVHKNVHIT